MLRSLTRVSSFLLVLGAAQQRYEFTEVHMGMPVRIVLYADSDSAARSAARAAFRRIAELDDTFSDYRPQSETRRLSARAGEWVAVSPELFEVLSLSVRIAKVSEGAFDPTAAPLVVLWRDARRANTPPRPDQVDSARALVGWRRISLDTVRRSVRLEPGTSLDFGGIAKGYILGEARKLLVTRGIASTLIEAGGDIVTGDPPPGLRGWWISAPQLSSRLEVDLRRMNNIAISTSGPSAQNLLIGRTRYSHVVDPRTGMALTNDFEAVVVGRDPALADAVATAATVLGPGSSSLVSGLVDRLEMRARPMIWIEHPPRTAPPRRPP
jgi:thiamine biosynthesis lipoprotein